MRGRKWSWSEKILFLTPLLFVLMAMATFLTPRDRVFRLDMMRFSFSNSRRSPPCAINLKSIGLAMLNYAQDYDDKLPLAASTGLASGWADELLPYCMSYRVFECPLAPSNAAKTRGFRGYSSYYLNRRLSGQSTSSTTPERLILVGEGDDGLDFANSRYSKTELPLKWQNDARSPLFRHLTEKVWAESGSYFLSLDGRVKWLKPNQIGRDKTMSFLP